MATSLTWVFGVFGFGIVCLAVNGPEPLTPYAYLYFLSYLKLVITLVKYVPQVALKGCLVPLSASLCLSLPLSASLSLSLSFSSRL